MTENIVGGVFHGAVEVCGKEREAGVGTPRRASGSAYYACRRKLLDARRGAAYRFRLARASAADVTPRYSFGGCRTQTCGIFTCAPTKCPMHSYRESIYLGDCGLDFAQVQLILEEMGPRWRGSGAEPLPRRAPR